MFSEHAVINHQIKLINPDKQINYHLPKGPDALKEELAEKISQYTSAGWWVPVTTKQAVLMLCILKKNGKLHMVFNLCMQNKNTEKDISPFLDQDTIQHDVVHATYRSKLDMSERISKYAYVMRMSLRWPSLPYSAHL